MRSPLRAADRLLRNPRVTVPLLLFAAIVLLFILQRGSVWLGHRERFESVTAGELLKAAGVGLRFDAVAAGLLVLPAVVVMSIAPPSWLGRRWLQWAVAIMSAIILATASFAGIADFYFFREFDERLNHKAIVYLDQPYTYQVIWKTYPVIPAFVAAIAVLVGTAWGFKKLAFRNNADDFKLIGRLAWPALIGMLLAIAIRGTLGPKAINAGPAYFSNSTTLAQLTLNPIYTLREAALSMTYRSEDLSDHLALLPEDEAMRLAAKLIVRPEDRVLNDPDNPLRRITDSGKPQRDYNVVLVVLESMSWHYINAMGGDTRLTPNFDKLIENGVLMERCFAVGDRTTRGFAGIVSGHPDLPGRSVTTRSEAAGNFLTIGHVLQKRGYQTMFLYAGQPMYDHRQWFLRSNGFEKLVFENEFDSHTFRTDLGWCDEDLFHESLRQFDAISDRPFLATLLTLSFHRPFHIPPGRITPVDPTFRHALQLDAVKYADWSIGQFMEQARKTKWFDNTLFVFVADHCAGYAEGSLDASDQRVPFLMYAPKILDKPRRVDSVCSQTDVIPTIMSVLGGQYEHSFFGSSVLDRPADAGMALALASGGVALIDHNGDVATVPFGGEPRLSRLQMPGAARPIDTTTVELQSHLAELSRRAIALLQTANIVFERGSHRPIK
jgi:phosphoglycerol transferase MdoB-like AlkP superfamily enzyme